MPIDPKKQIITLLYEYFYFNSARLERDYIEALEKHYRNMFQRLPERFVCEDELLEIIRKKARLEEFQKVQNDIHMLLKYYELGDLQKFDENS